MRVIGIDCATQPSRVGLAHARLDGGGAWIVDAELGSESDSIAARIAGWIDAAQPDGVLLALDAPLGWPAALGAGLARHRAGALLPGDPDRLFLRDTDRAVHRSTGRRPLEVGADRIARTAVAALRLLDDLGRLYGAPIPLAWEPPPATPVSAIEVYPAGTLAAHGLGVRGYKKKDAVEERRRILAGLADRIDLPADLGLLEREVDVLDAVLCVLAGCDFLRGEAAAPTDLERARAEGWIWVRRGVE